MTSSLTYVDTTSASLGVSFDRDDREDDRENTTSSSLGVSFDRDDDARLAVGLASWFLSSSDAPLTVANFSDGEIRLAALLAVGLASWFLSSSEAPLTVANFSDGGLRLTALLTVGLASWFLSSSEAPLTAISSDGGLRLTVGIAGWFLSSSEAPLTVANSSDGGLRLAALDFCLGGGGRRRIFARSAGLPRSRWKNSL
jgi:hypothetical protein